MGLWNIYYNGGKYIIVAGHLEHQRYLNKIPLLMIGLGNYNIVKCNSIVGASLCSHILFPLLFLHPVQPSRILSCTSTYLLYPFSYTCSVVNKKLKFIRGLIEHTESCMIHTYIVHVYTRIIEQTTRFNRTYGITYDTYIYTYTYTYRKFSTNSLVWGSLRLAPIKLHIRQRAKHKMHIRQRAKHKMLKHILKYLYLQSYEYNYFLRKYIHVRVFDTF